MPYLATDGFLDRGANELQAKTPPDGLLWLFGPHGGLPPFISQSGTLTTVAALFGSEALVDRGDLTTVVQLGAAESMAEAGVLIGTATLAATEALLDGGSLTTATSLAALQALAESGGLQSIAQLAGEGTVLDLVVRLIARADASDRARTKALLLDN